MSEHPDTPDAAEPRPAWGLLAALTALNVLAYVDRQLIVTLAPLLMEDLGLTRAEIGLLVGASFIVVFAGLNLVLGAAADRFSRPRLIAGGLAVWSVATALTGGVRSFAHMALMRVGVGVGEATLSPAALSMLGDRFPPQRLGLANSIFYTGIPLGFALSFLLAGWIGPWLGWRACFFILGATGLLAVAAIALMKDPGRRGVVGGMSPASLGELAQGLGRILVDRPAVGLVSLAGALLAFMSSASQHTITWLVQEREFEYARAAFLSAGMVAAGGVLGNVAIGAVTDWARRRHPEGRLMGILVLVALAGPLAATFYLLPATSAFFLPLWFVAQAWMLGWFGPVLAALDELAPPGRRAHRRPREPHRRPPRGHRRGGAGGGAPAPGRPSLAPPVALLSLCRPRARVYARGDGRPPRRQLRPPRPRGAPGAGPRRLPRPRRLADPSPGA